MILSKFLSRRQTVTTERILYEAIVAQARQPWFYSDIGVPDTVDGRFDMISLHVALVLRVLQGKGEAASEFAQKLFDEFFRDMDRSLRELGVSDISVGKRVRNMAEVFYGQADAYSRALTSAKEDSGQALKEALARNALDDDAGAGEIESLAAYVAGLDQFLAKQDTGSMLAGELTFPQPG